MKIGHNRRDQQTYLCDYFSLQHRWWQHHPYILVIAPSSRSSPILFRKGICEPPSLVSSGETISQPVVSDRWVTFPNLWMLKPPPRSRWVLTSPAPSTPGKEFQLVSHSRGSSRILPRPLAVSHALGVTRLHCTYHPPTRLQGRVHSEGGGIAEYVWIICCMVFVDDVMVFWIPCGTSTFWQPTLFPKIKSTSPRIRVRRQVL